MRISYEALLRSLKYEHIICTFILYKIHVIIYLLMCPMRHLNVFLYTIHILQLTKEKANQEGEDYDVATSSWC